MEEIVPNLSPPKCVNVSVRRGRLCVLKSVERCHVGRLNCPQQFPVERGSDIQCP